MHTVKYIQQKAYCEMHTVIYMSTVKYIYFTPIVVTVVTMVTI